MCTMHHYRQTCDVVFRKLKSTRIYPPIPILIHSTGVQLDSGVITVRYTYEKLWTVAGGEATNSTQPPAPQTQTIQNKYGEKQ